MGEGGRRGPTEATTSLGGPEIGGCPGGSVWRLFRRVVRNSWVVRPIGKYTRCGLAYAAKRGTG